MEKKQVIDRVRREFSERFELLRAASRDARDGATHGESQARSKYDTQSIEASYLAAGQAERAEEVATDLKTFNTEPFPPFPPDAPVSEGALVQIAFPDETEWFLLAPSAGGMTFEIDGEPVTVLGPGAPLRARITGMTAGATLAQPRLEIVSVQ